MKKKWHFRVDTTSKLSPLKAHPYSQVKGATCETVKAFLLSPRNSIQFMPLDLGSQNNYLTRGY